jgi:hypothetical protein
VAGSADVVVADRSEALVGLMGARVHASVAATRRSALTITPAVSRARKTSVETVAPLRTSARLAAGRPMRMLSLMVPGRSTVCWPIQAQPPGVPATPRFR